MTNPISLKISSEQAKEMPMVDLAFAVLKAANEPFYYRDLMIEIAKVKGISEEGIMDVIAQLYTEINIDGRFACVGTNLWGLKRWYPIDKDDAMGSADRPRIINDEDDDIDDEDVFGEEEEEYLSEDEDDDVEDNDDEDEEEDDDEEEIFDEEMEDSMIEESDEESEIDEDISDEEFSEEEAEEFESLDDLDSLEEDNDD